MRLLTDWIVPLSDVRLRADEIDAVVAVYRSGWLSQGPKVAAFEAAFAEYVGCRHAVATSSATTALHLICVAIGLGPGDEVVLPSLTFAATAATVSQTGATPVFADIRAPDRPWLSTDAAESAIGPRTRAVVAVSYGGHPGELQGLRELAGAHRLALVEDAAHALGSRLGARHLGTFGDAGAFSFFANKNLPLGEGGMLVTDDDAIARRARLLRSHGLSSGTWQRHHGGDVDYDVIEPGFGYRLDEARAALGLMMLPRLAERNARRAAHAERYRLALARIGGVRSAIGQTPGVTNAWHIQPLLLDEGIDRSAFRARLRDAGVQTSMHYPPLHLTRAFGSQPRLRLTVTEDYAARTVTVPLFPHMSAMQCSHVIEAVARAAEALTLGSSDR